MVEVGRVLFPGTFMGVPVDGPRKAVMPRAGASVIAALSSTDIGVRALVESVRSLDSDDASGLTVIGLCGIRRVRIEQRRAGLVSGAIADPVGRGKGVQVERTVAALRQYLAALAERGHEADVMVEIPAEPLAASYRVASLLRISAQEQQHLLEAPDAYERLAALEGVLGRERRLLEATT